MPWWTLPLIIGGAKITAAALNKPKSYRPDLSWLNKSINEKKSDLAKKESYNLMMQGASAQAGTTAARARRGNEANAARMGLRGSGIEAAGNLDIMNNVNRHMGEVNNQAMQIQSREDAQVRNSIDNLITMKEQIKSQYRQQNQMNEDQWKSGLINAGVDTALSFATAGIANAAEWNQAGEIAKAGGFEGDLHTLGSDPGTALKILGTKQSEEQGSLFYDVAMNVGKFSVDKIKEMWQNKSLNDQQFEKLFNMKMDEQEGKGIDFTSFLDDGTKIESTGDEVPKSIDVSGIPGEINKITLPKPEEVKDELIWRNGADGQQWEFKMEGNQAVDTGRRRPMNYQPEDLAKQKKAENTLVNLSNDIQILSKFKTAGTDVKGVSDVIANVKTTNYDAASDKLWEYAESLDLPIKGKNEFTFTNSDGTNTTINFGGSDDETKLFEARRKLWQQWVKQLAEAQNGLGVSNTGTGLLEEAGNFEW